MKNKTWMILGLILCMVLCALPVQASSERVTIGTAEEFLEFAENCRLDSYSQGLYVTLTADIDLQGAEFGGVPIFCGTFNGSGHTISGLKITAQGASLGLFRYLTQTALVMGLRVEGEVVPNGTRSTVGGIVGSNAGTVKNCSFSGTVQGGSYIGGIAGANTLTGVIQSCVVQGTVSGNHFTGGIAGENVGVIRSCDNRAEVNAAANQNTIGLSDITLETITGTEASNTVTDIGGIAGANAGVLRRCRNFGPVGYRQMGYNIGGIAGSQTGYILDCKNHAPVAGRKEVGGIVGQMEPVIRITFTEDTVQQLQGQMDDLSAMTQQASANAQGGANRISGELDEIQKQLGTAMDALEKLNPEDGLPDEDSLLAAQNAVSGAIAAMSGNMDTILTTAQQTTGALSDNLQAVANQMNAIGQTLGGAEQGLGGSLEDVSDQDTDQDRTSKVDSCSNMGTVLADMNAGGIVGAISVENDLDPEDELVFTGNNSLKFDGQVRSVVRDCHNGASVTANKQNAGGIIGLQRVGLVRECTSSATVASEKADYVGGIAGLSQGYIRLCSVKGQITGDRYVGSIAGTGKTVTDCRALTQVEANEFVGGVLGSQERDPQVQENYYHGVQEDPGAIDGISYAGVAQGLSQEDFFRLEALDSIFQTVTVRFVQADGSETQVELPTGQTLPQEKIPAVAVLAGNTGKWAGLELSDISNILLDMTFTAEYTAHETVLAGDLQRPDGLTVLMFQGDFLPLTQFHVEAVTEDLPQDALEAWSYPQDPAVVKLRYRLPEGVAADQVRLLCRVQGDWVEIACSVDGSYLVFEADGSDGVCLIPAGQTYWWLLWVLGGVILIAGAVTGALLKKRKKAKG